MSANQSNQQETGVDWPFRTADRKNESVPNLPALIRSLSMHSRVAATGLQFQISHANCIPPEFEKYIHAQWLDHNPRPVQVRKSDDGLNISHRYKESLRIVIPWRVDGLGVFFLRTVSLPRREKPYDLVLELARGTVGRLIDQTENWKASGIVLPDRVEQQLDQVKLSFRKATFATGDESAEFASVAIGASIHLMNEIGSCFSDHVFQLRKSENQTAKSLLGCVMDPRITPIQKSWEETFNAAVLPIPEYDEYCEDLKNQIESVCVKLHKRGVTTCNQPLFQWSECRRDEYGSVEDAQKLILDRIAERIKQCGKQFKLLYPVSEIGIDESGGWSDAEQIHLTFEILKRIRNHDRRTPLLIGFQQPFGESLLGAPDRKSPIQIADQLIRMDASIAAFVLEFNLGYYPDGSWTRDLYAYNDLLDQWSQFEFPLVVQLRIPGGIGHLANAAHRSDIAYGAMESQSRWIEQLTQLTLAKRNVAGVFYGTEVDGPDDRYPGSGLYTESLTEKPAIEVLRSIRQKMR